MKQNKFEKLFPLKKWFLSPNKSLGQNFLFDMNVIKKIVSFGKINENSILLEVGPGLGSLSIGLLETKIKKLYAIEKDLRFKEILNEITKIDDRFEVQYLDILKYKIPEEVNYIFANLPYNISVIFLLSCFKYQIENITVLLQKEVAERFLSENKNKNYGRISVLAQIYYHLENHYFLCRKNFKPSPKVDSILISFKKKNNCYFYLYDTLEEILKISFSHRRKLLSSTLGKNFSFILEDIKNKRCEDLTPLDYLNLSIKIFNFKKN